MKKSTLLTLVFIFVLSSINMAMAKDPGFGGQRLGHGKKSMGMPVGKWWKMPHVADKLALNQEEKEKLDSMYLQHRHQMIDFRSQVDKERLELEYLLDSNTFNAAASMDRFKKFEQARNNLATERFKFLIKVRELLGLQRFQQLKAEVRQYRMKGKRGRRQSSKSYKSIE